MGTAERDRVSDQQLSLEPTLAAIDKRKAELELAYAMAFVTRSHRDPSDAAIAEVSAECVVPPIAELYPGIRREVLAWRAVSSLTASATAPDGASQKPASPSPGAYEDEQKKEEE